MTDEVQPAGGKHGQMTEVRGTVEVDWFYPRIYDEQGKQRDYLTVGLVHTRAADDIRVSYSSERDGWSIEQADDDDAWAEVAFVQAWGRSARAQAELASYEARKASAAAPVQPEPPERHQGRCGCGWVGPECLSGTRASLDARVHAMQTGHLPPEAP